MAGNAGLIIRIAANAAELKKNLAESLDQIETTTAGMKKLASSLDGNKLIQQAHNIVAAVNEIGGATKLTEAEKARLNATLQKAIDKYQILGNEAPKAMRDLAAATAPVEQKLTLVQKAANLLQSTFGQFTAANLFSSAITKITSGITSMVTEAIDGAGHIVDLGNKTGLTSSTIQRMQFVAHQTGAELDAFTDAAFKLGVNLAGGEGGVVAAVKALGLSMDDLQRMNPSQQFETMVAALSRVQSQTERNRLGVELFGRGFKEIAASVSEGYDDIARHATVATDAQLQAIDRASDRWQQFKDNMKGAITTFIGQELLLQDTLRQIDAEARANGRVLGANERLSLADQRMQAGLAGGAPALFGSQGGAAIPEPNFRDEDAFEAFAKRVRESAEQAKRHAEELRKATAEINASANRFRVGDIPSALLYARAATSVDLDNITDRMGDDPLGVRRFNPGLYGEPFAPVVRDNISGRMPGFFDRYGGGLKKVFNGMTGVDADGNSKGMSGLLSNIGGDMLSGGINSLMNMGMSFLTKGIGKVFSGLFGADGKKTNDERDSELVKFTGVGDLRGAQDQFRKLAAEAGLANAEIQRVFDTKKPKDFETAFKHATDKIQQFTDEQAADAARLTEAIKKYGFSFEELGPKLQRQNLDGQAKDLIEDWRVLVDAGVDVSIVNGKMAEAVNAYLHSARMAGAEIPSAMRPVLQSLIQQGQLFDENGNLITDLSASGIVFAETMSQGFDRVIERLNVLIDTLNAAGGALDHVAGAAAGVGAVNVTSDGHAIMPDKVDTVPMAAGGFGRVTGPTLFLAGEAGPEDVAFSGAGRRFGGGASDDRTLRAILRELQLLPLHMKAAVQQGNA